MSYATSAAFRQALEQRLLSHSRSSGQPVGRLRKTVAFDRLLARLVAVGADRWILKGALALELRLGSQARATKDVDLVLREGEEQATADLLAAQAIDLGDTFVFAIERASAGEAQEAGAIRYRAQVELAGRLFEEIFVDVGFVDPLGWAPDRMPGTDLLAFAGIPRVVVPTLPIEQQVAEKVHAYTRIYAGGEPSSRPKDLVDIVLIATNVTLDARRLTEALDRTFTVRALQAPPQAFPAPPGDWRPAYRRLASAVGIAPALDEGYAIARRLIGPILRGYTTGRWDPERGGWHDTEPQGR